MSRLSRFVRANRSTAIIGGVVGLIYAVLFGLAIYGWLEEEFGPLIVVLGLVLLLFLWMMTAMVCILLYRIAQRIRTSWRESK